MSETYGSEILVVKADGTKEPFNEKKLAISLKRSGASIKSADEVLNKIKSELKSGMTTSDIYGRAFDVLRGLEKKAVVRYSLKRALADLGPSGFPFEKFVAEIYKSRGLNTEIDKMVKGHCVEHEIDIVAWNDQKLIMAEAKFHNEANLKSDLKVALYVKARYDDLKEAEFDFGKKRKLDEGWLITNTKFTDKAIQYAECAGVNILGWNYPWNGNLHDMILETGLHPITCLDSLSGLEKRTLLEKGVVLCKSVRSQADIFKELGISGERMEKIIEESNVLCPTG